MVGGGRGCLKQVSKLRTGRGQLFCERTLGCMKILYNSKPPTTARRKKLILQMLDKHMHLVKKRYNILYIEL